MSSDSPRLLLVDDDPATIQIMGRMLEEFPDQRFATSGKSALEIARTLSPDLILLDANMPDMTGFDVCEVLKSDPLLAGIPVIFVTSHDAPALEVDALNLGAADYVTKPLAAPQLKARVRTQLRMKKRVEDAQSHIRAGGIPPVPPKAAATNILIVDHDLGANLILKRALSGIGALRFAHTGEEGLQLARAGMPTVIIVDADLPDMDGLAVCSALKADALFDPIPVVYVARESDAHSEQHALDLGAADVFSKPFKPAVVQARIQSIVSSVRRTEAEIRAIGEHWRTAGQRTPPQGDAR
jgi:two-component system cell cycle response regulator